jgi:hypothetical protein
VLEAHHPRNLRHGCPWGKRPEEGRCPVKARERNLAMGHILSTAWPGRKKKEPLAEDGYNGSAGGRATTEAEWRSKGLQIRHHRPADLRTIQFLLPGAILLSPAKSPPALNFQWSDLIETATQE